MFEPLEFIRRPCAFVPPPYVHMVRYFGILAPHALFRDLMVPKRPLVPGQQLALFSERDVPLSDAGKQTSRIAWAYSRRRARARVRLVGGVLSVPIALYLRRFVARARRQHRSCLALLCVAAFCLLVAVSLTAAALVGPADAY